MLSLDRVILEYLKDPLLLEKGYLKEEDLQQIKLGKIPLSNKMLQLIKVVVMSKFQDESEIKTTREVNKIFTPNN